MRYFHFAQFALGIGFLLCGVFYFVVFVSSEESTTMDTLLYILGPGGAGYMIPKYWVTKRLQQRQQEIEEGFPDSLDMMLTCVEAGQSLDQSIVRVASEIKASYPALAEEFEIVSQQMKAGKDKSNVLGDMGERCGVQDISSFVTVLIQSQTFGTSIGDALRVYAGEMRDKRVMRAEEKANKLPTKMFDPESPYAPGVARNEQAVDATLVGHRLMHAGEYELAIDAFERAAVTHGLTSDILLGIGSASLGLGRLQTAERLLRQALDQDEFSPEIWNNLGVVLMELGETSEASQSFQRAYALDDGASDSIRDNLRFALEKLENPEYNEDNDQNYKLVRRGSSDYLIRQIP